MIGSARAYAGVSLFITEPRLPSDGPPKSIAAFQQWAATEEQAAGVLARRVAGGAGAQDAALATEPMFVAEIAAKCFIWARLPYKYVDPAGGADKAALPDAASCGASSGASRAGAALADFQRFAMAAFDLHAMEVYTDAATASKVLVGHRPDHVVVAVRGSKTALNAKHDAKVRPTPSPAPRCLHSAIC